MKKETFRFILYLCRWQLSSFILAPCLFFLGHLGEWPAAIIANLIGAIIMYPVDRFIFSGGRKRTRQDKNK